MKLLHQLRNEIRVRHYSIRTEQTYVDWVIGLMLRQMETLMRKLAPLAANVPEPPGTGVVPAPPTPAPSSYSSLAFPRPPAAFCEPESGLRPPQVPSRGGVAEGRGGSALLGPRTPDTGMRPPDSGVRHAASGIVPPPWSSAA